VTVFPRIIFILDIIDTYTLEIVGYKAGFSITKSDVIKTVTKAIASRHITDSLTIRTDNV
jgi:transposase InsO family protein